MSLLRRGRSVARQILALQLIVLLVVVLGSVALAYTDARRDADRAATDQVLAVALTVAESPVIDEAVRGADPSAVLQPYAESVRAETGTDFVVIMNRDGIRWTHPDPANIGKVFLGSIDQAQQGQPQTERYAGTLGPSIRAVVPVTRDGVTVALVSVGVTVQKINTALLGTLPQLAVATVAVLGIGLLGALLINRRLRRQTHGMGEREITRMYEYYDTVLRSVREGLILIDRSGQIQLINSEGARLLGVDPAVTGSPIERVGLPESLVSALVGSEPMTDEIHLVNARMLVFNRRAAGRDDHDLGSVITFRDHTEIQALSGELDTVRSLADSLRSQNHEAANRLHTVVSLIEIGRPDDAVAFAIEELQVAQLLTDQVVSSVDHPVIAALLLGKMAEASERGVQLQIRSESYLRAMRIDPHDAVTMLGNLIDNAIDATGECDRPRQVAVELRIDEESFKLQVDDSGPGLDHDQRELAFRRGWSTKTADNARFGRGIGLALVVQLVRRHSGRIEVGTSDLGGASFMIDIDTPPTPWVGMTFRVLVVEDEEVASEAHAAYVGRLVDFEIAGVARTARAAADFLAADDSVDLILLDMHLPDGHGLGLLRHLRAAGHACDVIAVTSARDLDVVKHAVAQGVVAYLIKPFTFAAFRIKLNDYATFRRRLAAQHELVDQGDVDAMLAALRPRVQDHQLPKGLTRSTLALVTMTLRDAVDPVTASQVAAIIGASRVTARRYLEHLADSGSASRESRYGGAGRPEVEYRWSSQP